MLEVARIRGGNPIRGTLRASGSKNSALPILAASLLTDEKVTLHNIPNLSDVGFMVEILKHQGALVNQPQKDTWEITAKEITHRTPYDLVRKMRASVCLLGALVGRLREAEMALPGGCVIGIRPIDLHLKGLESLNCSVEVENGIVKVNAHQAQGGNVFMGGPMGSTVTGTANIIMAATLTPGITKIESAALEPEISDLCIFLNKMGAKVSGYSTPIITVEGVEKLHGCEHTVISDRIEVGTYCVAAAITNGNLTITNCNPSHLESFLKKLKEAGIQVESTENTIRISGQPTQAIEVITEPYPGFPTDLQAQFMALQLKVPGRSTFTEKIYPSRFMHAAELQRMGAEITIDGATAAVYGDRPLSGAPVMASDLRASAALILAALTAEGETWVQRLYHLDRGYEQFEERLRSLGADIVRLPSSAMPKGFAED